MAAATRYASTGYSRFDAIQLEESKVQSGYNLVENASFELDANADKMPDQWTKSFTFGTGEGIDTTFKHAGKASFKMVGQAGVNRFIKQRVNVKGNQNNKYTLSGWSYADNPDPNGGYYAMQVAINNDDGTVDWRYSNDFTRENHAEMGWEHVVAEIKPTKAFSSMDVYYYFYNQRGNAWFDIMRLEEGNKIIDYGYDVLGNFVTSVKDPVNNTTNFEYDGSGNRTKVIDPKTKATSFSYDQMNRITKVTDALQGETTYGYDDNGNRTTVKDAKNNTTTYGYNEINQVKSIIDPLNKTTGIDYDLVGNQTAINYPNGNKVGFGYDKLSRVTSILFNGQNKYSFGYDQKGNRTAMTDVVKSQTTQYSYDADDKLKTVTESNGNSIEYGYDKTGNLESLAPKINGITYSTVYTHNELEQIFAVSWGSLYKYVGYDENGNITGSFNANKTQAQLSYDDAGKVKSIKNLKDNGTKIGDYGYSYDTNGNITQVALESDTLGSKTISYTYDDLNRLTKETLRDGTTIDYYYDAVGNRTQRVTTKPDGTILTSNYTYDAANQLLSVNSNNGYTWDNGNMTSDGSKNFEYDANNRLVKVTNKATGAVIATYEYDADGRRTIKTTSTGTVKYFYDGDSTRVLYETDGNNVLLVRYIYDQNEQLVAIIKGAQAYFYHYNAHGDVVALTDLSGNVVAEYDYDAYGQPVATGLEGTVENSYRYAGYRWDSETGMYYLNARYYWPAVGRFITRDSFQGFEDEPTSFNKYNYAHSNPVSNTDPTGYFSINIGFGSLLAAFTKTRQNYWWTVKDLFVRVKLTYGFIATLVTGYGASKVATALVTKLLTKYLWPSLITSGIIWAGSQIVGNVFKSAIKQAISPVTRLAHTVWRDKTFKVWTFGNDKKLG